MKATPDVIFTYGTLRPGLGERPEAMAFREEATHLGRADFQGKLYSISWYPAVVDSRDPADRVIGDLFRVGTSHNFFERLDAYEGCSPKWPEPYEYVRVIRTVRFEGHDIPAWVYLFNWDITDQTRIESGDFADHVPTRR